MGSRFAKFHAFLTKHFWKSCKAFKCVRQFEYTVSSSCFRVLIRFTQFTFIANLISRAIFSYIYSVYACLSIDVLPHFVLRSYYMSCNDCWLASIACKHVSWRTAEKQNIQILLRRLCEKIGEKVEEVSVKVGVMEFGLNDALL